MILALVEDFERHLFNFLVPHERNEHRPLLLRSNGLFLFLVTLLLAQSLTNFFSQSPNVLGFATNISISEIISLTNQERSSSGLGILGENAALNRAAELKGQDMIEKDYWDHYAPDGTSPWYFFGLVGYKYSTAGENLARDFSTSSGVVSAWMASSGHRANILNSNFTEIGVGVVNGNFQGEDTTLVVQLFGRPVSFTTSGSRSTSGSGSVASAPTKVETKLEIPGGDKLPAPSSESKTQEIVQQAKNLPVLSLFEDATTSQKVTITLLFFIAAMFILDSIIIFRKKHIRLGSHSFAHAAILLLLIGVSLLYGKGFVL